MSVEAEKSRVHPPPYTLKLETYLEIWMIITTSMDKYAFACFIHSLKEMFEKLYSLWLINYRPFEANLSIVHMLASISKIHFYR